MILQRAALAAMCCGALLLGGCFYTDQEIYPLAGGIAAPFDTDQPLVCIQYDTTSSERKELDRPVIRFIPYVTNGELQYAVVTDEWEAFGGLATFHHIKDDIYVLVFADEDSAGQYIFITRADRRQLQMLDEDPETLKVVGEKHGFADHGGNLSTQGTVETQRAFVEEMALGDLSTAPVELDCKRRMTEEEAEAEKSRILEEIEKGI